VQTLNAAGLTVVYTSHYMEEVQALCPRIAILDAGRLIACDTRDNLLRLLEGTVRLTVAGDPVAARAALAHLPGARVAGTDGGAIELATRDVSGTVLHAVRALRDLGADLTSLETNEPSLERVFLHLTEKALRD
jgi:ABC-2 type transport system ATP-binding protein